MYSQQLTESQWWIAQTIAVIQTTKDATFDLIWVCLSRYTEKRYIEDGLQSLLDIGFIEFNPENETYRLHKQTRKGLLIELPQGSPEDNEPRKRLIEKPEILKRFLLFFGFNPLRPQIFSGYVLHHNLASHYYHSERLDKSEWKSVDDIQTLLDALRHLMINKNYELAYATFTLFESNYLHWGHEDHIIAIHEQIDKHLAESDLNWYHYTNWANAQIHQGDIIGAEKNNLIALDTIKNTSKIKELRHSTESLGDISCYLTKWDEALAYYKRACDYSYELDDAKTAFSYINHCLYISLYRGDVLQSQIYIEKLRAIANTIDDESIKASLLNSQSNIASAVDEFDESINYLMQAVAITEANDDFNIQVVLICNRGANYSSVGNIKQALVDFETSLALCREHNIDDFMTYNYRNIGGQLIYLEKYTEAIDHLQKGLTIANKRDQYFARNNIILLTNLACAYVMDGQVDNALETIKQAREFKVETSSVNAELWYAIILMVSGHIEESRIAFQHDIQLADDLLAKFDRNFYALYNKALAQVGLGILGDDEYIDKAKETYQQALAICKTKGLMQNIHFELTYVLSKAPSHNLSTSQFIQLE